MSQKFGEPVKVQLGGQYSIQKKISHGIKIPGFEYTEMGSMSRKYTGCMTSNITIITTKLNQFLLLKQIDGTEAYILIYPNIKIFMDKYFD